MIPAWLHVLAILALVAGFACTVLIAIDVAKRPQPMWIMNAVWPTVALFGTAIALWCYFRFGRAPSDHTGRGHHTPDRAFPVIVGKGTSHCGAGCTLGDICAEWLAFAYPSVAVWFGWHSLFDEKMFAVWALDFLAAFGFGIAFQYFAIAPMRKLGPGAGLVAALKADTLSLAAWQVGMYGFMAFASLYLFRSRLGVSLEVNTPEFWFMMQIAMLFGFATAFPVNWWLIRVGIKEKM